MLLLYGLSGLYALMMINTGIPDENLPEVLYVKLYRCLFVFTIY